MKVFSFRRNFKQLGFRSQHWQQAKLIMKQPLYHIRKLHRRVLDRFSSPKIIK